MDEENCGCESISSVPSVPSPQPLLLCKCLLSADSSHEEIISERKKLILSTVSRTENYLRERRIPEILRFIINKIIADRPQNPADYGVRLLDDCMMFRAGLGMAPVLYEDRHLEAVVKSFDPSQRGWLNTAQVRRAFTTLGLTPEDDINERIPTDVVLENLRTTQEQELFNLLSAGTSEESSNDSQSSSSSTTF